MSKKKTVRPEILAKNLREANLWEETERNLENHSATVAKILATWQTQALRDASAVLAGKDPCSTVIDRTQRSLECADKNPDSALFEKAERIFNLYLAKLEAALYAKGYVLNDHLCSRIRPFGAES